MSVRLTRSHTVLRVDVGNNVELTIEPYTSDRLSFRVVRVQKNYGMDKSKTTVAETLVTYFDISLDDLGEIYGLGIDMLAERMEALA